MLTKKVKFLSLKSLLILLIIIPIVAYFLICLDFLLRQNQIIFAPYYTIEQTPQNFGLDYQEILISIPNSEKKENLFSWWIPAQSHTEKVLLYFHGTDCNIADTLKKGAFFHELGFSVLLFDYRGFGKSKGKMPTEKQVYEDGQIAYDYLVKTKKINPQNILVYGHSLGGAVAIDLALHNPQISGLILQGTFTTMEEVLRNYKRFKFLPLDLMITEKFNSLDKIASLKMPLLFIHGTKDPVVAYSMSEKLFETATTTHKKLVLIPKAEHNNVMMIAPEKYKQEVEEFYQLTVNN